MKKLLFALSFIGLFYMSCSETSISKQNNSTNKTDTVTISGQVLNFKKEDSIHSIKFYVEHPTEGQQEFKMMLDDEGSYSGKFPTYRKQSIGFIYKTWLNLIVEGGDSINIKFDGSKTDATSIYDTFTVSGTAKKINNTLFKYMADQPINNQIYYEASNKLAPERFKMYHDSIYDIKNQYLKDFISNNDVSKDFENYLAFEKEFESIERLIDYQLFNPKSRNEKYESILPEDFLANANNVPKMQEGMLINSNLISSFSSYYTFLVYNKTRSANKELQGKQVNWDSINLKGLIDHTQGNTLLQRLVLNEHLSSRYAKNDLKLYIENQKLFDSIFKNSFVEKAHKTKIQEIKDLIENPVLPENTSLLSFSSKNSSEYIAEIINNANGKVVFIDNWATWCGPCRAEFKSSTPELKKKFGDQVEFVYLCYQSEKEAWKPMISQYKIEGKHYFITKEDEKELFKQINLQGFPTYTIINKNGEIVKSGFEYRPSEAITSKILTQLVVE